MKFSMVVNIDGNILDGLGSKPSSKLRIGKDLIYLYRDIDEPGVYDLVFKTGDYNPVEYNPVEYKTTPWVAKVRLAPKEVRRLRNS